jgi:hypothetical protein
MKIFATIPLATLLFVGLALAQPAPYYLWDYLWESKANQKVFCAQISPGEGWEQVGGPFRDSHCKKPLNQAAPTKSPALTSEEMDAFAEIIEGTSIDSIHSPGTMGTMNGSSPMNTPPLNWAFDIETAVRSGGYSVCQLPNENRPHIDCGRGCKHTADKFISWNPGEHQSCVVEDNPKVYCDPASAWSGWVTVGGGVGNPCPGGCKRGGEIGLKGPRSVGVPPFNKIQFKHKFECLAP